MWSQSPEPMGFLFFAIALIYLSWQSVTDKNRSLGSNDGCRGQNNENFIQDLWNTIRGIYVFKLLMLLSIYIFYEYLSL